jgi:hypothetical protein
LTDAKIRDLLLQSQPDVYRAGENAAARQALQTAARETPTAVLEILLEDLIWRLTLEQMVLHDETRSLEQIIQLAKKGDFERAYQSTELAINLQKDKALLLAKFKAVAQKHLIKDDE